MPRWHQHRFGRTTRSRWRRPSMPWKQRSPRTWTARSWRRRGCASGSSAPSTGRRIDSKESSRNSKRKKFEETEEDFNWGRLIGGWLIGGWLIGGLRMDENGWEWGYCECNPIAFWPKTQRTVYDIVGPRTDDAARVKALHLWWMRNRRLAAAGDDLSPESSTNSCPLKGCPAG